jgi:hypothetical protein
VRGDSQGDLVADEARDQAGQGHDAKGGRGADDLSGLSVSVDLRGQADGGQGVRGAGQELNAGRGASLPVNTVLPMVTVSFCAMLESVTVPLEATTLFTRTCWTSTRQARTPGTSWKVCGGTKRTGRPGCRAADEIVFVRVDDESNFHFNLRWVLVPL